MRSCGRRARRRWPGWLAVERAVRARRVSKVAARTGLSRGSVAAPAAALEDDRSGQGGRADAEDDEARVAYVIAARLVVVLAAQEAEFLCDCSRGSHGRYADADPAAGRGATEETERRDDASELHAGYASNMHASAGECQERGFNCRVRIVGGKVCEKADLDVAVSRPNRPRRPVTSRR